MRFRPRSAAAALAACALLCALPGRALASGSQQAILMDDQEFVYDSPTQVRWAMEQARELGVDRIKVSVVWQLVAPNPRSKTAPSFNASDPSAYPPGAWNRYDTVVTLAQQLGLQVYFQLTPPAPDWAVSRRKPTQGYNWSQYPSPSKFRQFVTAVGTRYSGTYVPDGSSAPLPRVSYWGIWNEPNEGQWLNPQWRLLGPHKKLFYVAPAIYRGLVDAAYSGLSSTGHAGDTILIGEIAAHGWIHPIPFLRALYCVGSNNQPLRGTAAKNLECPTAGSRSQFMAANPGLFKFTGFAHHPYSFDVPPNVPVKDWITLQNLAELEKGLDKILAGFGQHRPGGVPLYLTEWGYKSKPPNPFVRTSLAEQAKWLNEGEYIAWSYPYVRALAQFELVDSGPDRDYPVGTRNYWRTFQTGLMFVNDKPKPSYDSFRLPIWVPNPKRGPSVLVWAQIRPADHLGNPTASLQFKPSGGSSWNSLATVTAQDPEEFVVTHLALSAAGSLRLAWYDPETSKLDYSRTVHIS